MPSDEEPIVPRSSYLRRLTEAAGAANATRRIICSLTEQKSDAWLIEDFDRETRTDAGGHVP